MRHNGACVNVLCRRDIIFSFKLFCLNLYIFSTKIICDHKKENCCCCLFCRNKVCQTHFEKEINNKKMFSHLFLLKYCPCTMLKWGKLSTKTRKATMTTVWNEMVKIKQYSSSTTEDVIHTKWALFDIPQVWQEGLAKPETTVYSDRLLINYPPISYAFDNRVFFSALYKRFKFDIIEKWPVQYQ